MATLLVPSDKDFSGDSLSNIDTIAFTNAAGSVTAIFDFKQFDGLQILPNVQLSGSAGANHIVVNGGDFDASTWTFANWTNGADTITINGTADGDTLTGSSRADIIEGLDGNDTIRGGAGADTLRGGEGNDHFFYDAPSDMSAGESVDGGGGTADAIHVTGTGTFDMRGMTIQNVERLVIENAGTVTVQMTGSQIGGTSGLMAVERASFSNAVQVHGSQIDLSGVAPGGRGFALVVEGGAGASATGSSEADTFSKGNSGPVTMSGGAGDDIFTYYANSAAGDSIDGGAGSSDQLTIGSIPLLDLTGMAGLSGIEQLWFNIASDSTFVLTAGQMASGITRLAGNGFANHVIVSLTSPGTLDLSGLTFTGWTSGIDTITIDGSAGADTITGTSQADTIVGGAGADNLRGGGGADTFVVSDGDTAAGETYSGNGGNDRILVNNGFHNFQSSTITSVERLEFAVDSYVLLRDGQVGAGGSIQTVRGSGGADNLHINGNAIDLSSVSFANWAGSIRMILTGGGTATGSSRADVFVKSGAGAVTMQGGGQNDVFNYADGSAAGDVIDGGAGNGDEIAFFDLFPSFDFTQASITGVERLRFFDFGDSAVTISSSHIFNGLTRFIGGNSTDHLIINIPAIGGVDLNTLTFQTWSNADQVTVNGSGEANAIIGNAAANILNGGGGDDIINGEGGRDTINGGAGHDTLDGGSGNDIINGGGGNDTINGGAGQDRITGGAGRDTMTGGGGNDTFIFNAVTDSAASAQRDLITDFSQGADRIRLSDIASFAFIAGNGFSGTGGAELRFHQNANNNLTIISGDADGDGIADFQIGLTGLLTLVQDDFIL